MVVGVCGFTYTGSGAVNDLLKEYEEAELLTDGDFEFSYVYRTDGILDLKHHLVDCVRKDIDGDFAIYRFMKQVKGESTSRSRIQRLTNDSYASLSEAYIENLTALKWNFRRVQEYRTGGGLKSLEGKIRYRLQRYFDNKCNHYVSAFPSERFRLCCYPSDFDEKTKSYVMGIIQAMRHSNKQVIVVDQPFIPTDPVSCFPYFEDPRAIIVDRDPRDLFLMYKRVCFARGHLTDKVSDFIEYYKKTREGICRQEGDKILRIKFEGLIYRYEETVSLIENFLNISQHNHVKEFFQPDVSIKNTRLIRRFPDEKENISIIEKELTSFLYPFESYY